MYYKLSCASTRDVGQMLYMEEWKMIVFLGTPQMNDLDAMIRVGLYINDLSMHDFSRYCTDERRRSRV